MISEPHATDDERRESRSRRSDRASTETASNRIRRIGLAVIGSALLVRGIRKRSLRGMAMGLVGGYLLTRALGGGSRIKRALSERAATGPQDGDGRRSSEGSSAPTVSRSVIIDKPADELYETWRDPERLSRVVGHVGEVTAAGEDRLRWTVRGPGDREFSWETEIVEEVPGEFLRWKTPDDAVVPNEGSVRFREAPGDRGTQVGLSVSFDPPGGALGSAALTRLDIVPSTLAGEALNRFKRLAETGEVPTLEGNPSGRGKGDVV